MQRAAIHVYFVNEGGRREDTCDHGLSSRSPRAKLTSYERGWRGKNDDTLNGLGGVQVHSLVAATPLRLTDCPPVPDRTAGISRVSETGVAREGGGVYKNIRISGQGKKRSYIYMNDG